jgi:tetratricopeptide (TPR) repeat protein
MGMIHSENPTINMIDQIRQQIYARLFRGEMNFSADINLLRKQIGIAKQMGAAILQGRLYECMALVYFFQGDSEQALISYDQAYAVYQLEGEQGWMANCRSNMGELYRMLCQYDRALPFYEEALQQAAPLQDVAKKSIIESNAGLNFLALGRYSEAETCFESVLTQTAAEPWLYVVALMEARRGLGEVYLAKGDTLNAWRNALEAMRLAQNDSDHLTLADIYLVCAHIAARDPQATSKPDVYYRKSRELLTTDTAPVLLARAWIGEAHYQARMGNIDASRTFAQEAYRQFVLLDLRQESDLAMDLC